MKNLLKLIWLREWLRKRLRSWLGFADLQAEVDQALRGRAKELVKLSECLRTMAEIQSDIPCGLKNRLIAVEEAALKVEFACVPKELAERILKLEGMVAANHSSLIGIQRLLPDWVSIEAKVRSMAWDLKSHCDSINVQEVRISQLERGRRSTGVHRKATKKKPTKKAKR